VDAGALLIGLRRHRAERSILVRKVDEVVVGIEAAAEIEPGADHVSARSDLRAENGKCRVVPAFDGRVESDLRGRELLPRSRETPSAPGDKGREQRTPLRNTPDPSHLVPSCRYEFFAGVHEIEDEKSVVNLLRDSAAILGVV
jgi:hypothetical protein